MQTKPVGWLDGAVRRGGAVVLSTLLAVVLAGPSVAQTLTPAEAAERWMHYYYADPQPQQFVEQVQQLAHSGVLSSDKRRIPTQVFLATLLSQHPVELEQWMAELHGLSDQDQQNLQLALWRADTAAAKKWLKQQESFDYEVGPPKLSGQPVRTALQVEMLWHRFYATGDWDLVRQLVSVLEEHRGNSLDGLTAEPQMDTDNRQALHQQLFSLALWSLELHAANHPQVLEALGRMYAQGELSLRQQQAIVPILESLAPGQYVLVDDIAAQ